MSTSCLTSFKLRTIFTNYFMYVLCKVIVLTLIEWWLKISSLKLYRFLVLSYLIPSEWRQENTKKSVRFLSFTPGCNLYMHLKHISETTKANEWQIYLFLCQENGEIQCCQNCLTHCLNCYSFKNSVLFCNDIFSLISFLLYCCFLLSLNSQSFCFQFNYW